MGRSQHDDPARAEREFSTALRAMERGDWSQAEKRLRRVAKAFPENAPVHFNLAVVLRQQNRHVAAVKQIQRMLDIDPTAYDGWLALAENLVATGDVDAASNAAQRALTLQPERFEAHLMLGQWSAEQLRWPDAVTFFRSGLDKKPLDVNLTISLAQSLTALGQFDEAVTLLRNALDTQPNQVDLWLSAGEMLQHIGRIEEAVDIYRESLIQHPASGPLQLQLANCLSELQWPDEAKALYDAVLQQTPGHPDALNNQALLAAATGQSTQAETVFRALMSNHPDYGDPYRNLSVLKRFNSTADQDILAMRAALRRDHLSSPSRAALCFALGKALDDCGEYDEAFDYFRQANDERYKAVRFDINQVVRSFDDIKKYFDQTFFEDRARWGEVSRQPIFIIGLPRSGTTLLEQVLAAHPDVAAAGELRKFTEFSLWIETHHSDPYPAGVRQLDAKAVKALAGRYLDELTQRVGEAERVTDKMPMNFFHAGLIHLLFPEAAIIHCNRNPMDTALSIYCQHFPPGMDYAYRFEDIAAYYHRYVALMAHWRGVLGGALVEVDYEQLVSAPRETVGELLESLGLVWSDACLAHHTQVGRVETLSLWQVRQPLNSRSIGRWRRYESQLQPLIEALAPTVAGTLLVK